MLESKLTDKRRIAHIKSIWKLKNQIDNEKHKGHIMSVNDLSKNYHELINDLRDYDKFRGYQTERIVIEIKKNLRFFLNERE